MPEYVGNLNSRNDKALPGRSVSVSDTVKDRLKFKRVVEGTDGRETELQSIMISEFDDDETKIELG